jgi:hypothetical protein
MFAGRYRTVMRVRMAAVVTDHGRDVRSGAAVRIVLDGGGIVTAA